MKALKLGFWGLITLGFLILAVSLIGQNAELIEISLFHWTSPAYPKWAVLLGAAAVGAFFSFLFFVVELLILETKNIRLRRANAKLERTLSSGSPQATTPSLVKTNAVVDEDV
jgi:uncharacterized integral membrane protein